MPTQNNGQNCSSVYFNLCIFDSTLAVNQNQVSDWYIIRRIHSDERNSSGLQAAPGS
jgi:hypothetical protein